ncbi:hypothetical protein CAMRE0001_1407 [Campylobacter rectus RM3267]|uniref:Uncharacterized protein n=1 Tax=Campylobacter rectus RM3267 TaxID=553218 RepID=B9D089_CAMRE|nr:hypothetical protein CAMRE0001_1407 [Campylobacter rectus RM3267]
MARYHCFPLSIKFYKFDSKFERKTIRRSIFVIDEALLNLVTGVTVLVMTEPNLKATKHMTKRQAANEFDRCRGRRIYRS